jgi:hypothetical protein
MGELIGLDQTTANNIEKCRELLKAGTLIPFIGSGLSSRFKLPTSEGLLDVMASELDWDSEVFRISGDLYQLAEYFVAVKGEIGYLRTKLDKMFDVAEAEVAKSKAHQALVSLDFPIIYTTNWDTIIEKSFKAAGKSCKAIVNIHDIAEATTEATQIVKFHGDFADDDSLVLTETSYFERLEFETALDIKLRADILGKTLLFIGHSLADINIRFMLHKLKKLKGTQPDLPPTAIMVTFAPSEVEKKLYEKNDVLLIALNPINRDKSIDDFLGSLL